MNPILEAAVTYTHTPDGLVIVRPNRLCIVGGLHFHEGPPIACTPDAADEFADSLKTCARRAREAGADATPDRNPTLVEKLRIAASSACLQLSVSLLPSNTRAGRTLLRGLRDSLDASKVEIRK